MAKQPTIEEFILAKLHVTLSRLECVKGFPFEFELGRRMVQKLGSFVEGSGDLMTWTSTPKSVEEVATKVMKAYKVLELFQTMAIVSLNMGNLTIEVNTLKNRLVMGEKEKIVLMRNLIRREISRRGINIMWKSRGRTGQSLSRKIKCSLRNCRMRMRSSRVTRHG